MHGFPGIRFFFLISAALSWPAFGQRSPPAISDQSLIIRIYNLAHVPSRTLDHAIRDASEILSAARVDVTWQRGSDSNEARTFDFSMPTVKRPAQDYRGYIVLGILHGMPSWFHPGALGYALPHAQTGVNATIFYDRIECWEEPGVIDLATVLGHVIAHEIGHVLLRSTEHSNSGIMRAIWSKRDFRIPRPGAAQFTARQRAAIAKSIALEGALQARQ
jgi:hypothetical protein